MNRRAQIALSFIVFLFSLCSLFSVLFHWGFPAHVTLALITCFLYYLLVWLEKNNTI